METAAPTPNRDNIRLWVEALRSGKFEQGNDWLRNGDQYCCLGVACEVALRSGLKLDADTMDSGVVYYGYGDSSTAKVLPVEVRQWLGLSPQACDPYVNSQVELVSEDYGTISADGSVQLTACNDVYKLDFAVIADMIENTYLKEGTQ